MVIDLCNTNRKQLKLFFQVYFSYQTGLNLEENFGDVHMGLVVLLKSVLNSDLGWKYIYHLILD